MSDRPQTRDADQDSTSRQELYRRAREMDIEGRSTMSKAELREAVDRRDAEPGLERLASRFGEFERLAEAAARGAFVMLPRLLSGNDRRLHVRQTLREDHDTRIMGRSEDALVKLEKLSSSLFSFFRGTALLFYRDMAGEDAWMPTVLTLGDVHPDNFGVMPNADNVPIFAVNDFDEAYYAPFTWDVKRGTVGFMIATEEIAGYGSKQRRKIARSFIRGYIEGIRNFADNPRDEDREVRLDNAPKMIRKLIEDAQQSRAEWLADDYLDEFKRGFRANDELVPVSGRRAEFQALIEKLIKENDIEPPPRAGRIRVKDVAIRRGQGTASLGLARFYVLIEGPGADGSDDLIIELKRARRSALAGLAPPGGHSFATAGERIAHAQGVQLVRGDRFYGSVDFDGMSFMSRERAPFRDDIDLDDLSKSGWKDYAAICGDTLAHAHALTDATDAYDYDIEPLILKAIGPDELFIDDMLRFAEEAAERVRRDHRGFRADHELGAFHEVDIHFK